MRKNLSVQPPSDFETYSPSRLFRFFFQLGRWTEESFSADFQTYTRGKLVSSVTVNKWKNHDVIPTRYSGPFFKLIDDLFEPVAAKSWIAAFEIVWATFAARIEEDLTPQYNTALSDKIGHQHSLWIRSLYHQNLFGENFSPADIFVPLQLLQRDPPDVILFDIPDILSSLETKSSGNPNASWTVISGLSGSGKSMMALHLAKSLSHTDIMPIYLRGQNISEIDLLAQDADNLIIDAYSVRSFLKYFRSSSKKTACLFIDGPAGISAKGQDLTQLLSNLRLEQNICRSYGKTLHIIVAARAHHFNCDFFVHLDQPVTYLEILGLDGSATDENSSIIGEDKRHLWWQNYLRATRKNADSILPDFLSVDYADLLELGRLPASAFKICHAAMAAISDTNLPSHEIVNKFTYSENRHSIYADIVHSTSRDLAHKLGPNIAANSVLSILKFIALARWQTGFGKPVSSETVLSIIDVPKTMRDFASLLDTDKASLIDAVSQHVSYFLLSKLIFERFSALVSSKTHMTGYAEALKKWSHISSQGAHDPELADFCQKEASLNFDALCEFEWDLALTILHEDLKLETHGPATLNAISNSASLLFFTWSCLNLERHQRSGDRYKFQTGIGNFNIASLKRIQPNPELSFDHGSRLNPRLTQPSFLASSLSGTHFISADFSQLSFSAGHMEQSFFQDATFALSHWCQVKITNTKFENTAFQQPIFYKSKWNNSEFVSCLFRGANFQHVTFSDCHLSEIVFSQCYFDDAQFIGSSFEAVIFDRCIFTDSHISASSGNDDISGVKFRHCTFIESNNIISHFSEKSFENCEF